MSFDIEPRRFIYNRTGNFSQTTTLNGELAEKFMRVSDLRLDVVIADSDKKPEQSSVSVGSDVLAWRSIVPLSELTKVVLGSKKFRQTQIVDGQYRIQIHDQIISDEVRKKKPVSAEAYEQQYLARLRGEVKAGLVETIRWEKLGHRMQFANWLPYLLQVSNIPWIIHNGSLEGLIISVGMTVFLAHPLYAFYSNMAMRRYEQFGNFINEHVEHAPDFRFSIPPYINPRDWKHALMPTVPFDKWITGRRFLAQHGNDLIVARS